MFRIDEKTNKIYITKGDTAQLVVSLFDKDGNVREIYSDDTLVLTVRKRSSDNSTAISLVAENGVFNFIPATTKSLPTGYYYYDIELTTFGGNVYTIIPTTLFEIGEEITR